MVLFLLLVCGFCWSIVYVKLIHLGFRYKACGIPFIALALNFAWESVNSYFDLKDNILNITTYITLIWLYLDILVILTYLLYGKRYFPKHTNKEYFWPWTLIIFIMSFVIQYFFIIEFGDLAKFYSAFIQNLIMSISFIIMLVGRPDIKGQRLTIAINKCIGTLAATISSSIILHSGLIITLGIFCFIFDTAYIYFLSHIKRLHSDFLKSSTKI
ncbi:MAG: hypothetical protein E7206_10930 [Clostridium beijerinckii]|nr:hypothetical protein [Clostridium beijerinckii]